MEKDVVKKEIDIIINERNHLWNALIITLGGTFTLLFNANSILHYFLIILGLGFTIIFLNGYFTKKDLLKKLLYGLKEAC